MAEPSSQDVFKLINSMVSFEKLLDATALNPETCVNLGIHEKFKQLHEKLAKYIKHEETKDLTFKSICNVCCNEIKILKCDIRTSVAIHNADELHRVAAKIKEINEQDQEFGGKSVQQSMDFKNFPNKVLKLTGELLSTIIAKNVDVNIESHDCNLNLKTKSALHSIDLKNIPNELFKLTGELPIITAKSVSITVESQDWDLDLKTVPVAQLIDFNSLPSESMKPSVELINNIGELLSNIQENKIDTTASQLMDFNNIPNELLRETSTANSISQKNFFVSHIRNTNVTSICTTCLQVFCICGYEDNMCRLLNQKMSNVNMSQQGGTYSVLPQPLGGYSLFSGGIEPQAFTQTCASVTTGVINLTPQSCTNKKSQEKGSAKSTPVKSGIRPQGFTQTCASVPTGVINLTPQSCTNKKSQEKGSAKSTPVKSGIRPKGFTQTCARVPTGVINPTPQSCTNNNPQEKGSAKSTPVKSGIRPKGFRQTCTPSGENASALSPTNKKPQEKRSAGKPTLIVSNPPRQHLTVNVHMPLTGGQQAKPLAQPAAIPQFYNQIINNSFEENLILLRSRTLGHQHEMHLMYRMLRQAEGGYWRQAHFTKVSNKEKDRNEYVCNVCNRGSHMISSLQVVEHARGKSHQVLLRSSVHATENVNREPKDAQEQCWVM